MSGQRVLIIGATSAIAAEVARQLAPAALLYLLGGRSQEKLGSLVGELGPAVVGARTADLDDTAASEALVAAAIEALGGLDLAVVAHGLLGDQLASERDYAEAEAIFRTNLLGTVSLLIPLANHFERAGGGHIAVLSSVAAERGRPHNYTYAAAKGALNVYLQGVRSRLWSRGTQVHVLKLGPTDTPMTAHHAKDALFARPPSVARAILAAVAAGRSTAYIPWFWRPVMAVVRDLPEPVFQRIGKLSRR